MAEPIHNNTNIIYPLAKESTDAQSSPTGNYPCRLNQSNLSITKETKTKPTTAKSSLYKYKLRLKYKPDKNRLTIQQILALEEKHETIGK